VGQKIAKLGHYTPDIAAHTIEVCPQAVAGSGLQVVAQRFGNRKIGWHAIGFVGGAEQDVSAEESSSFEKFAQQAGFSDARLTANQHHATLAVGCPLRILGQCRELVLSTYEPCSHVERERTYGAIRGKSAPKRDWKFTLEG
jgi:hypothetical protein